MLFISLQKKAIRVVNERLGFFGKAIAEACSPSLFHICVVHGHEFIFSYSLFCSILVSLIIFMLVFVL
jgi:hypothetical protein